MDQVAEVFPIHPQVDYYKQWAHHRVGIRIRVTEDYIVHIDIDGKLDWESTLALDAKTKALPAEQKKALNAVYGEICVAETSSTKGSTEEDRKHFYTLLGEAYVHWLDHDSDTARAMVKAALNFHQERSEEKSRYWYLIYSIDSAALFLVVAIVAWLIRDKVMGFVGGNAFYLLLATCSGAVGAMFSVIARSGKLKFKASAGRELHKLEASSRIFAGAVSGIIVYLALKSELVLGTILNNQHRTEFLLLASLAAGAGERLATSIISKFDDASVDLPLNSSTN